MKTHADKIQEHKSHFEEHAVSQNQRRGQSTFQFIDNRPEVVMQRKQQEMVNNASKMSQIVQLQAMANKYSSQQQVVQLANGGNAYNAGQGAFWHVHHAEHVKFGGLGETRINFGGRNRNQVLRRLNSQKNVPPQSQQGGITYQQCVRWILRNI
ncbi:hypothetical protein ACFFU1_10765 [Algibacter miyuki]|uniref:Uncharacterized protein n=1 Tax=Algibacter miyuki TaxID=1306933 RepID=A0ABV5H1N2_9FLAO|nr:hypothetical protein [Algibacter miyuki]MDN3667374.1 hypothetical protein [Algibacter miyuki]